MNLVGVTNLGGFTNLVGVTNIVRFTNLEGVTNLVGDTNLEHSYWRSCACYQFYRCYQYYSIYILVVTPEEVVEIVEEDYTKTGSKSDEESVTCEDENLNRECS